MKIGELVHFHEERYFEGAVQLRWVQTHADKARQAAEAYIFHGPRYHAAAKLDEAGGAGNYRLKDSASFVRDLLDSLLAGLDGKEENPYWMVVAGYGSGKSHLALTSAALLGKLSDVTDAIIQNIRQADKTLGDEVSRQIARLQKPVLVLPLDGMAGFHLGNALSQAVFAQLRWHGVDAEPIRELSPRFQTAEQFVERNFAFRADAFANKLPGLERESLIAKLRDNDEEVYARVDAIYWEANGSPIPVVGQESAQELINLLCQTYCGPDGAFSSVVILFDEFGRYLEYAADKPRLAGDAALQQIFQGVQDNSGKVRLVGFIQYELKAYLQRFSSADLRQLQRYITRFDTARKWYLSTNLETLFAHVIGKREALAGFLTESNAERQWRETWQLCQATLPGFQTYPVWAEFERFARVIGQGCWPLHPLATWFLTRQQDIVQSRSAMMFIKEMIDGCANEDAWQNGHLRQISAAELVLDRMLPELIAAERETGANVAETLQLLLAKFQAHAHPPQRRVLAGVAILAKLRVGKQSQATIKQMLAAIAGLSHTEADAALQSLTQELGALEWNNDLGQYELIADAASRAQFQLWLRQKEAALTADDVRNLFVQHGGNMARLGHIETDFALKHDIKSTEWRFEARFAHAHILGNTIQLALQDWDKALQPTEAKGRVIYCYVHADDDVAALATHIQAGFQQGLQGLKQTAAPVWVVGLVDSQGTLTTQLKRLQIFATASVEDAERFRRFISVERERGQLALQAAAQECVSQRVYFVAGIEALPSGRLKEVAEAVFERVYPQALPFPFDGFATANGGGPADAALLMRSLAARQVDGEWVRAQAVRVRNRATELLVRGWRALQKDGSLTAPAEPKINAVYQTLRQRHQAQPDRSLWESYRDLIAPPHGMNASSASLLIGFLLGTGNPPCRIMQNGEILPTSEWADAAFPPKKHCQPEVLKQSRLRFLAEDAESRWRDFLVRWDNEQNYAVKAKLAKEAETRRRLEPLPEVLEERHRRLQTESADAQSELAELEEKLKKWETDIEQAERRDDVGRMLKTGSSLIWQQGELQGNPCWPANYLDECEQLLTPLRGMIAERIGGWIPRQTCHSAVQVGDFRTRMEKAVASLRELGFRREADTLEQQYQNAISRVGERQKFQQTLDQSDDYPRLADPTPSTPVRELRDGITLGNELIAAVQAATAALNPEEISARVAMIQQRQQRLDKMLKTQEKALSDIDDETLDSEGKLREMSAKLKRLGDIFIGTRDQTGINDLLQLVERILADVGA